MLVALAISYGAFTSKEEGVIALFTVVDLKIIAEIYEDPVTLSYARRPELGMIIGVLLGGIALFGIWKLYRDNSHLKRKNRRDKLTKLYNRRSYEKKCLDLIEKYPDELGIFYSFDIHDLRSCNDTYGYEMGDRLIIKFSKILKGLDDEQTVCFRIAGDEFGMFKVGFQGEADICFMMKRVEEALTGQMILDEGIRLPIKVSGGASIYNVHTKDFAELKKFASLTMNQVKKDKKVKSEMDKGMVTLKVYGHESLEISDDLIIKTVLRDKRIRAVYQPIYDLNTDKIYGFEGLSRVISAAQSDILKLIELAKNENKLQELDLLMMETTVCQFKGEGKLFINMEYKSPSAIKVYIQTLSEVVSKNSILMSEVVIEVSEKQRWEKESIATIIDLQQNFHFLLAIDDFGIGFSNNFLLLNLQPDIVKIDRHFVQNIHKDTRKYDYLKHFIQFIKSQNIKIICEGIETEAELKALKQLNSDYGQGYYLGNPK